MKIAAGVLIALVLMSVLWAVGVNNSLVRLDQDVKEKWAEVENVYQRRADLVPNLVETVKGFAIQERTVLREVVQARASATQVKVNPSQLTAEQLQQFAGAQATLGGALSRLLVTVERYPELKSNQNFLELQIQLEGTENRIAVERRRFNEVVRAYNNRVRMFPGNIIAGLGLYQPKPYFEATKGAEKPPTVKF